jgi:hypothetical protein
VQVTAEVATKDSSAANAAQINLLNNVFQYELQNQGLPGGKVVSSTIKVVHFTVYLVGVV